MRRVQMKYRVMYLFLLNGEDGQCFRSTGVSDKHVGCDVNGLFDDKDKADKARSVLEYYNRDAIYTVEEVEVPDDYNPEVQDANV